MKFDELAQMLNDKYFYQLKKMRHKYSPARVDEMIEALKVMGFAKTSLFIGVCPHPGCQHIWQHSSILPIRRTPSRN